MSLVIYTFNIKLLWKKTYTQYYTNINNQQVHTQLPNGNFR